MSSAIKTDGTTFEIEDGVPAWVAVGEILSIDGPGGEAAEVDVTSMDSSAREYRIGLPDEGLISLTFNHVQADTGQVEMRTARNAQSLRNFRITFSNSKTATFAGFVKGFAISASVDDAVRASASIRVTGPVTYSA